MNKTFNRVRSAKDMTITALFIIIGCVLAMIPDFPGVSITGYLLIFTGIVLAVVLKTVYKDEETGKNYHKKEYYFQKALHSTIMADIQSKPESIDISQEDSGSSIKLEVYYSKKHGNAFLQLFEYIPYDYEPCSDMYEYEVARVAKLIK